MIEFISEPNLVYVLFLAGLLGLFLELKNPGLIVPGAISIICLLIVFGIQTLPLNNAGVFAIVGGFSALILEIYVSSFGLLGVLGVSSILYGSHVLFDSDTAPGTIVSRPLIWSVGIVFSVLLSVIASLIAKTQLHSWSRYGGQNKSEKRSGPDSGDAPNTLHIAEVVEQIGPSQAGKIFYKGTYWNATRAEEETGAKGATQFQQNEFGKRLNCKERVEVVGWSGLTAKVKPYQKDAHSDKNSEVKD